METNEPVDADQASAALASVQNVRTRVAWSGYPAWYWLATGAALGAVSYVTVLPHWWAIAITVVLGVLVITLIRAASRARGVCEGWTRGAMTRREVAVLYGPASILIVMSSAASKVSPWSPIVAAAAVFLLFAGTGLMLSARAARR